MGLGGDKVVERIGVAPDSLFYREHVARYEFALGHVTPGLVLDIACGSGYGARILSHREGVRVVGVDLDLATLLGAKHSFADNGAAFVSANACELPFATGIFRSVVTLETIEHIRDDGGFLREIRRVLSSDGVMVISTPSKAHSIRHNMHNPYHIREYYDYEFFQLLRAHFADVTVQYQGFAPRYYDEVQHYKMSLKSRKQVLGLPLRLIINRLYRPLKHAIPVAATNLAIRSLLGLTYPQPSLSDIIISPVPPHDASVQIAVCRQPNDAKASGHGFA